MVLTPALTTSASATTAQNVGPATTAVVPKTKTVKTKAKIRVTANKKSYVKGKKGTRLTVRVTAAGKKASGIVKVYDSKKRLKTLKLAKGKATYTLPKNLKAKKHKITVKFGPSKATSATVRGSAKTLTIKVKAPKISRSAKIMKEAKKHVGVRYRYGGTTPRGFDCSGFTSYVYKKAGVKKLPRSSSAQRTVGKRISKASAKPGDLIWSPGHVAIYLGGNKQIDAPRPGKTIQVRSIWQSNPTFIRV